MVGVRPAPCEERGAGRGADGYLTVGSFEYDGLGRERVEVWRYHLWVAVGAELRAKIVNGYEEHVLDCFRFIWALLSDEALGRGRGKEK